MSSASKPAAIAAFDIGRAEKAVRELLIAIGEDPEREGLRDTPARVARAYRESFEGLQQTPNEVLSTIFDEGHDEMVLRSLQRLVSYDDHGKTSTRLVETTPKTVGSAAQLPMPRQLTAALQTHRQTQRRDRLAAPAWSRADLVFTTQTGTPLEPRNISRHFQQLTHIAGLRRLRLHDLRHSAASFLLLQGVDLKTVQTMLRHTRMATTADLYLHVHPQLQRDAGDRIEQLLHPTAN